MQYITFTALNGQSFLADKKEVIALKEGINDQPDFDKSSFTYRLVYGTYKPQNNPIDHEKAVVDISKAIEQWLVHIDGKDVIDMTLEGVIIAESFIKHSATNIGIAALIRAPEAFEIDERKHQVNTAFLRQDNEDILTTLRNRKGFFAFTSEEKGLQPDELTRKNWYNHVDEMRILKESSRA